MGHTILTFQGEYYEYGAEEDIYGKGLTIGGFECAWLADLVASYVLEKSGRYFSGSWCFGM